MGPMNQGELPQGEWKKHGIQMLTWSTRASDLIVQGFVCLS